MNSTEPLPEIYCDFNARMTDRGFSVERAGSVADLEKLGLSLEQAVGKRFLLNGGDDENEQGEPADIMCRGVIVKDSKWGYLAVTDTDFFWRAHAAQQGIQADGPASGGSAA